MKEKKVMKVLLVLLMIAGLTVSIINFSVSNVDAAYVMGHDIVDEHGNAWDCMEPGNQCMIVFPDPPKN